MFYWLICVVLQHSEQISINDSYCCRLSRQTSCLATVANDISNRCHGNHIQPQWLLKTLEKCLISYWADNHIASIELMIVTFRQKLHKRYMAPLCKCHIRHSAWQPLLCTARSSVYLTVFFDGPLSHLHGFFMAIRSNSVYRLTRLPVVKANTLLSNGC